MANLVISNDSGPLHLAHILHTPAIGIYWIGNMITGMPLTSNHTRQVISWTTCCPLCGVECRKFNTEANGCRHDTSFVDSISVAEVETAVIELMDQRGKQYHQEAIMSV
jgi:ADP-heptose:LPS heptosyltransferase